jgi:hypothetical protein
MINIRKKLKKFFDEYSHNVIYVRRDERFRCVCYIERSGEPTPNCPICFGTSYVVQIEKKRTRRNISAIPETLIGANRLQQAGRIASTAYIYYFEHDVKPAINDLVLDVIWDINGVPRRIEQKHLISAVEPKLGYKGRVEFYQVYARYDQKGANDDNALTEH